MPRVPSCCAVTDRAFTEAEARRAADQYRKGGPPAQTRYLLDAVRSAGLKDVTLLDVGGGIGAIHHELLEDIARSAVHVDASSAYLKAARTESSRRGHLDRVTFLHADFTEVYENMPDADVVTLDRVVCCYPDYRRLLQAAAQRTRSILAMSYPVETWYTRLGIFIINCFERLRGELFRAHVHPVKEMEQILTETGLRQVSIKRFSFWEVALYKNSRQG